MAQTAQPVQKELHKSRSGLRILARLDSQTSPFLLDEPHWTPDSEIFSCQKCDKKFNFTNRKHHCRRCGRIFCDKDVNQKLPLPRLSFVDPVRLCDSCGTLTRKENEFFDKHLKTLTAGAAFNVVSSAHEVKDEERPFHCRLTNSSHRFIEFQGSSQSQTHDRVDILSILKVQVLTVTSDAGNPVATGLTLSYQDLSHNEQTLTFKAKSDSSRKLAMVWIVAMQKAMKMLFEGKSNAEN